MMPMAHLHRTIMRWVYVMSIDQLMAGTGALPEKESDNTLTVAREFSPALTVVDSLIHVSSRL
jgi:hypothetical protein